MRLPHRVRSAAARSCCIFIVVFGASAVAQEATPCRPGQPCPGAQPAEPAVQPAERAVQPAEEVVIAPPPLAAPTHYRIIPLTSDQLGEARVIDRRLRNPWGIAFGPNTPIWVANNAGGLVSVYDAEGQLFPNARGPRIILVPSSPLHPTQSLAAPTDMAFNTSADFIIRGNERFGPSRFIVVTAVGMIAGFNPNVNPTQAIVTVDRGTTGAVYKGVAIGQAGTGNYLFVTNFRDRRIEVYDGAFRPTALRAGFADPDLPSGYAPHGIRRIGSRIFVTYARPDNSEREAVAGSGSGYVSEFNLDGEFVRRFASGGPLNAPYAIARAPRNFGNLGDTLLIGNTGDGRINAFNLQTGDYLGHLTEASGSPIRIPWLHALEFHEVTEGEARRNVARLYFTAGIDDNRHGLFGRIEAVSTPILGEPVGTHE